MNGIEKLIEKIYADAAIEDNKAIEEYEKKIAEIKNDAQNRINEINEAAKKKAELEKEEIFERAKKSAVTSTRDVLLGAKQQVIKEAFERAIKSFNTMEKGQYISIISKYLNESLSQAEFMLGCTLILPQNAVCTKEELLLTVTNKECIKEVVLNDKIDAGFILKTPEIELSCTPEKIIMAKKEALMPSVVEALFSK